MTLIDGIGDEVVQFFIALFVIVTIAAAWWTTNIRRDQWQIRTVYLIDRPFRRRTARSLTNHTESTTIAESTLPVIDASENDEINQPEVPSSQNSDANKPPEPSTSSESSANPNPDPVEQEQHDIIETMDADTNVLRQRRLDFYDNKRETGENSSSSQQVEENTTEIKPTIETNSQDNNPPQPQQETQIRIKLKYINDDLRLVDGRLEELLGDFKRRHFSDELSSNKLVRLIFNGQVLQRDNDTLQSCGFFDNCVVHCLVHQQRSSSQDNAENRGGDQSSRRFNSRSYMNNNNNNNNNNRDWDLSNVLIAMASFSLGTAWYFRYQYPHLFTVTATVALVAITGVFTVVSVGMYFPDPEPVQPQVDVL